MNTLKFLAVAALGVAVGLLVATEKGEDLREDITDAASKWKKKLTNFAGSSSNKLSDLKDMVSNEVEGLSNDARKRISKILDEGAKAGKSMKASLSSEIE